MRTLFYALLLLAGGTTLHSQEVALPGDDVVQATPSLHQYLDSSALHTALARLPATPATKRVERVFRVEFDSAGQPRPPRPAVPSMMPAGYRDAVGPLIHAALRPIHPRRRGWAVLLLVEAGSTPRIEKAHLPERPPSVANLGAVSEALYGSAQRMMERDSTLAGSERKVFVEMQVGEDGTASEPRVVTSSGLDAVDAAALRVVPVIRFRPALLDGEPAPARVVLPIRIVFSNEP